MPSGAGRHDKRPPGHGLASTDWMFADAPRGTSGIAHDSEAHDAKRELAQDLVAPVQRQSGCFERSSHAAVRVLPARS